MAGSTITRNTLTDDSGSAAAPAGDGTILNNSVLQNYIYARVDEMFAGAGSYATFTLGGKLAVEGFGSHGFSAGGTGGNVLYCRNTSAGAANQGEVRAWSDSVQTRLHAHSSTYTTAAPAVQSGSLLEGDGSGGMHIAATHASGYLSVYTGGPTERLRVVAAGNIGIVSGEKLYFGALACNAGAYIYESAANVLSLVAGGVATTVESRGVTVPAGTVSAPSVAFADATGSGIYSRGGDDVSVVVAGAESAYFTDAHGSELTLSFGAFGAGAVRGRGIVVGYNSSGSGSPGTITLQDKAGAMQTVWVDSTGVVRVGTTAPTETAGDTGGTVVGSQTSARDGKDILEVASDTREALAALVRVPVYKFRYKSGAFSGSVFTGIISNEMPEVMMDPSPDHPEGRSFSPVSAFGYTALAIKELDRRLSALESAGA